MASAITYTFAWGAPGYCTLSQFGMSQSGGTMTGKAVLACPTSPASLYARVTLRRNGAYKAQAIRYSPGVFNISYSCQGSYAGSWTLEYYFNMKDRRGGSTGSKGVIIRKIRNCR